VPSVFSGDVRGLWPLCRLDDNLGIGTRYLLGIQPNEYGYGDDFLSTDDIRT
jgi:hypothetical protein